MKVHNHALKVSAAGLLDPKLFARRYVIRPRRGRGQGWGGLVCRANGSVAGIDDDGQLRNIKREAF